MSDTIGLKKTLTTVAFAAAAALLSACGASGPGDEPRSAKRDQGGGVAVGSLPRREGIPTSGVELGYGWNTRRSEVVANHCIEFTAVRDLGQVSTLEMHEVSDQSEMMEHLDVSAQASVKTMFASVSAKASFARDSKVSSNSTNLLLRASVENGVLFAGPPDTQPPARSAFPVVSGEATAQVDASSRRDDRPDAVRLKSWAKSMMTSGQFDKFRRFCGDSFVSAIYTGGQVLATISFSETNSTVRSNVTTAVKASYGAVHAGASANTKNETNLENTNLDVHYLQVGGGGGILPASRDQLMSKLETLPTEIADRPMFNEMEVTAYDRLPEWSGPPLSTGPGNVDDIVADYYWFLTTFHRDIENVLTSQVDYELCDQDTKWVKELKDLQDTVLELRQILLSAMQARSQGELPVLPPAIESTTFFPATSISAADGSAQAQSDFTLDLAALEPTDQLIHPDYENWYEKLADQLRAAVPFENPSTLRLRLPLPADSTTTANCETDAHKTAVVDWYVGRQSARMCERDPLDNGCLSRSELQQLNALVKTQF